MLRVRVHRKPFLANAILSQGENSNVSSMTQVLKRRQRTAHFEVIFHSRHGAMFPCIGHILRPLWSVGKRQAENYSQSGHKDGELLKWFREKRDDGDTIMSVSAGSTARFLEKGLSVSFTYYLQAHTPGATYAVRSPNMLRKVP